MTPSHPIVLIFFTIQIDSVKTCISFTNQYHSYSGGNSPTAFENIQIKNLNCKVSTDQAISMEGLPEMPIKNVELYNVTIESSGEPSSITDVENLKSSNMKY